MKLVKQLMIQSRLSAIIFSLAIGCVFLVAEAIITGEVSRMSISLELASSIFAGLFLHEFLKAREATKNKRA